MDVCYLSKFLGLSNPLSSCGQKPSGMSITQDNVSTQQRAQPLGSYKDDVNSDYELKTQQLPLQKRFPLLF